MAIADYLNRPGGWHGLGGPALGPGVRRPAVSRTTAPIIGGGIDPATTEALQKAMAFYDPEGGFGKGVEAGIERGRTKAVAGGMQGLVSAGLAGTTMVGGLGKKFEEEVAMPARERVEETRAERLSGLQALKAQIIQGATEAARSRALQGYLARLQAGTSLQSSAMRPTSSTSLRTSAPIGEWATGGTTGQRDVDSPVDIKTPEFSNWIQQPEQDYSQYVVPGGYGSMYGDQSNMYRLADMAQKWLGESNF